MDSKIMKINSIIFSYKQSKPLYTTQKYILGQVTKILGDNHLPNILRKHVLFYLGLLLNILFWC